MGLCKALGQSTIVRRGVGFSSNQNNIMVCRDCVLPFEGHMPPIAGAGQAAQVIAEGLIVNVTRVDDVIRPNDRG